MMNTEKEFEIDEIFELSREDRIRTINEWTATKPGVIAKLKPWWWFAKCEVNVLIVVDGLDYNVLNGFGLTEFVKIFEKLQNQDIRNIKYKVTLAHTNNNASNASMMGGYSFIHDRITGFTFNQAGLNLNSFDQIWIFGIGSSSTGNLSPGAVTAITNYMDGGGGLFATGDHGALGSALCKQIPRVKDMRYWENTTSINDTNEVSMNGRRRNDTNRPGPGQSTSLYFDNQSDDIPQTIGVRTFGSGLPHPLLSIRKSLKANGIIDIMPDHPHEGECTQEKSFSVNAQNISSQIIATSFVLGGSTTNGGNNGKTPTDPHCFPSISVFDGRPAKVGRIVIDSTWHHFVNINLNGLGSNGSDLPGTQPGLTPTDFRIVEQYFMNISTWMTRKKKMLCTWKFLWLHLKFESQLIEASMNTPNQPLEEIDTHELMHIGTLAHEILAERVNPAFAYQFMVDMVEQVNPEFAEHLDIWRPVNSKKRKSNVVFSDWIDYDKILGMAVGAGFIALRDKEDYINERKEESLEKLNSIFFEGVEAGLNRALETFEKDMRYIKRKMVTRKVNDKKNIKKDRKRKK